MKKIIPLLISGLVFVAALALIRPEETVGIVTAARDLPAGHTIVTEDLAVQQFPESLAPPGAYTDPGLLISETLSVARTTGDVIYPRNLGGENIELAPDERAIAIRVDDSGGLAGLLKPGDRVGLTAVLFGSGGEGAFAKTITGDFRVLYISPEFVAADPFTVNPPPSGTAGPFGGGQQAQTRREDSGSVVLAVSTGATIVAYDFAPFGVDSAARVIHLIDLLPALDHAANVALSLFLEPESADRFITSGIYLPDLVITPGPSPTPTETPFGQDAPVIATGTPTP